MPCLPAAQRSSPFWRKHTWLASQAVWLQVTLLWTEHVQRVVQVFSVYQLSPNCGAWPIQKGNCVWSLPFPHLFFFLPSLLPFSLLFPPLPQPLFSLYLSIYIFYATESHYVAQAVLEFTTLLPQPSPTPGSRSLFFSVSQYLVFVLIPTLSGPTFSYSEASTSSCLPIPT